MSGARILAGLLAVTLFHPICRAQSPAKPKPGDLMIEKYLAAETDKLSKKFMDGAKTLAEWQEKRPRLYREYMDMLGLWPIPDKTPLKVTFTGTIEGPDFFIDKLHYQSKPGLYVTANLYRPADSSGEWSAEGGTLHKKYPAVLYVCGHSWKGRDGNKSAYQDHGIWFAKNGYICLVLDTLQLGEIPGVHHGTYGRPWAHLKLWGVTDPEKLKNETRWWWHAAGYTPAGVECWNGIRGIDYLLSRPDVDPGRIAVTGISGGGAATFWIAAADERVQCAVPVSGMSDLESYVKNKVINGHCDCMFLYNTYQWDWTTIAALVAPRPLLFANSDNDPIFPMDANRRIIAKLRKIYQMYGKPELVDDYVSAGGHAYRPDLRVAIFKWINKHVKGDTTTAVKDVDGAVFAGRMLRVFREDDAIPKDALNASIDKTFVLKPAHATPKEHKFRESKEILLRQLRERSFPNIPEPVPMAKPLPGTLAEGLRKERTWEIEPNALVRTFTKDTRKTGDTDAVLMIIDGEYAIHVPNKTLFVGLFPRGLHDTTKWEQKSPPNYVERSHALLGSTVDSGRVRDVIAVIRKLNVEHPKLRWHVGGLGKGGIIGAYAALFEPSIKEVVITDPPRSHREGPYFLNVLRVLDIPEALGLLAPDVKLTLINARDPVFERTAEIYRLAGAGGKFVRK